MSVAHKSHLAQRLMPEVATFFPGYFALIMATGIVSIATHLLVSPALAQGLLFFNIVAYAVLWVMTLSRLIWFRHALFSDLTHHALSVTFLTMVAGTMVLGSQFAILTPNLFVARVLWLFGFVLWVGLIYTFFAVITLRKNKPSLEQAINGAWLLVTVSTESICVLGTLVAPTMRSPEIVFFISLCAYLLGVMFYIVVITLVLYRWIFFDFPPDKLTPPYWINMGALAITTLAGSRLLLSVDQMLFLGEIESFLKGFTLFIWAAAAWWIPLLVIVGIWKHGVERVPITYNPQYWSLVFPLGMFTVSTYMLIKASGLDFLSVIPTVFVYISLAAWFITFFGMIRRIVTVFRTVPAAREMEPNASIGDLPKG